MARISGRKQSFGIAADDQTAVVPATDAVLYIRNIDIDGQSPEVDVTAAGDDWQQYVAGAAPGATLTFTFVTDVEASQGPQAWDEWADGLPRNMGWYAQGAGAGLPSFEFAGIVLQHSTSSAYDGSVDGTCQVRINSLPAYGVQS